MMRRTAAIVGCLLLCACSEPRSGSPPPREAQAEQPPFVGKAWMSTDAADPVGTLRIFLPNGILVMDSCWETYRLAEWRAIDERRIEWREDTARIEAEAIQVTGDRLRLRLQLAGETKEETYRLAQVPFVCPDLPR